MSDIQSQLPVKINDGTNLANVTSANALKVDISATGANTTAIKVDGSTVTQPVSGSVSVSNFPVTQPVSGSVSVSNFPVTQPVSGSVSISGTVTTASGEVSGGIITFAGSSTGIANGSVGTITYTVTAGKTLYLKQVHASSSGAPCKVVVDYGASPTQIAVGFFSAAMPVFDLTFSQPISIAAGTAVNIKITNNAGATQDVYATIFGHEI